MHSFDALFVESVVFEVSKSAERVFDQAAFSERMKGDANSTDRKSWFINWLRCATGLAISFFGRRGTLKIGLDGGEVSSGVSTRKEGGVGVSRLGGNDGTLSLPDLKNCHNDKKTIILAQTSPYMRVGRSYTTIVR